MEIICVSFKTGTLFKYVESNKICCLNRYIDVKISNSNLIGDKLGHPISTDKNRSQSTFLLKPLRIRKPIYYMVM